jgi:hypothetical protein
MTYKIETYLVNNLERPTNEPHYKGFRNVMLG